MYYYWLVPLLIIALLAIGLFAYAGKRKAKSTSLTEGESTEAIKRGRYLNK